MVKSKVNANPLMIAFQVSLPMYARISWNVINTKVVKKCVNDMATIRMYLTRKYDIGEVKSKHSDVNGFTEIQVIAFSRINGSLFSLKV